MVTFTVDKYGRPGMPTFDVKRVRKLLKSGKAEIFCYHPFTVKLLYAEELEIQPVEICVDTGDKHIGAWRMSQRRVISLPTMVLETRRSAMTTAGVTEGPGGTVRDTGSRVSITGAKTRAGSLRQWSTRKIFTSVS